MGCGASTVAPDGDIYKEKEMLPIAQGEDKRRRGASLYLLRRNCNGIFK